MRVTLKYFFKGFVRSTPNTLIANIKLLSLLVSRVTAGGSRSINFYTEDVMIFLSIVFKPMLANITIKTMRIATDMNPPVAVVYSLYPL